jgi:RHS repeat-associated protein
LVSQKRGTAESFYLVDGLGSTRGLTNSAGTLTDSYTYDAFGNLVGSAGSTSNSYLFAGEQLDAATGDYYLRQRFYDAGTGRFTRRDTYEGDTFSPITLNKYVYGNGNPVNYTDPSGLFSIGEANAAASIGNILNEIQFESGNHLISATLSGGDYDGGDLVSATAFGLALAGGLPLLIKGVLKPKQACFVAGTEILTPDGEENIEDIEVGDWVIADDPNTPGEIEKKRVVQTFEREVSEVIDLYVDGEVITTTNEHPFWVPGTGWVKAEDLQVGMLLQTDEEAVVDVDRIERRQGTQKVYNFQVEGFHTYFVSDLGILVHNTNCGPTDSMWDDLDDFNNPSFNSAATTPKGRRLTTHADLDSLARHGFEEPFDDVDDIIDNATRTTQQADGANVYIKAFPGKRYAVAIVTHDDALVTAIKDLTGSDLRSLGRRYGFNPNP